MLRNTAKPELLHEISPIEMHHLSQMTTPPGVLTICKTIPQVFLPETFSGKRIFYLDSIRDPGNLGTILRIADWFGLDYVICSPDSVDIYNHKVLQSSMGSALRVPSCEMSKDELLMRVADQLYICDTEGISIQELEPPTEGIIVLGNESLGVSDELMHKVKTKISIPGDKSLGAESLNVASAAAIIAAWWRA